MNYFPQHAPSFFDYENMVTDKAFGHSDFACHVFAMSAGYFAWDLAVSTYYYFSGALGRLFVLHAVCSLMAAILIWKPLFNYYGVMFLMFELSTPFTHFKDFLYKIDNTKLRGVLLRSNKILLNLVFGTVRILFGLYQSFHFLRMPII